MRLAVCCTVLLALGTRALGAVPEVAEIVFGGQPQTNLPAWVTGVQQAGGNFMPEPACWQVDASQPQGVGRLSIGLDRQLMKEDLAMGLLYDETTNSDVAVQLFDAEDRVVVLDLFGNLMAVGHEVKTDTFIIPLRKYPTATKISLRRINGPVKIYGATMFPVVTEAEGDLQTLDELARLLGDPLSPENPLKKGMAALARHNKIPLTWLPSPARSGPIEAKDAGGSKSRELDWFILPFPKDSDWPGPRGEPARWEKDGALLLQGQPVRSRRSYQLPATVELELELEARHSNDGAITIEFQPVGVPLDQQGGQVFAFILYYGNPGVSSGPDKLILQERLTLAEGLRPVGKTHWLDGDFKLSAGKPYRVSIRVDRAGTHIRINDQAYEIAGAVVPYGHFQIGLHGTHPPNHWRVRDISVH